VKGNDLCPFKKHLSDSEPERGGLLSNKRQIMAKGQSKIENPEKLAT
jgi:hypothetical protein